VTGDLKKGWSPEQIAGRLRYEHNRGEAGMPVSHETIYTWIYAQPKDELARAGIVPRTGREQRKPRGRKKAAGARITGMRSIEDRPAEVAGRQVPGHWEGDLVTGKQGKSAMGTLVERVSRYLCPAARPRRRLGERSPVRRGEGPARAPAQVADLGPGHRDGPARRPHPRRRPSRVTGS
jgi:IS30 family transposase